MFYITATEYYLLLSVLRISSTWAIRSEKIQQWNNLICRWPRGVRPFCNAFRVTVKL